MAVLAAATHPVDRTHQRTAPPCHTPRRITTEQTSARRLAKRWAIRIFTFHIVIVSAGLFVIGPLSLAAKSRLWCWGGCIAMLSSSLALAAFFNRNRESFGSERLAARPWAPTLNWAVITVLYVLAFLAVWFQQVIYAAPPPESEPMHVAQGYEIGLVVVLNVAVAMASWIMIKKYVASLPHQARTTVPA